MPVSSVPVLRVSAIATMTSTTVPNAMNQGVRFRFFGLTNLLRLAGGFRWGTEDLVPFLVATASVFLVEVVIGCSFQGRGRTSEDQKGCDQREAAERHERDRDVVELPHPCDRAWRGGI